ncbi:hypothetical protein L210DRAFT_3387359, partial [Boletus edulis BED1]
YAAFLYIVYKWCYIKVLKQAGWPYDSMRNQDLTFSGLCAVICPACPQPGCNAPNLSEITPSEW